MKVVVDLPAATESASVSPPGTAATTDDLTSAQHIAVTERRAAHNYHPLPVVLNHGEGAWVTDLEGGATWIASRATRR